jgi:nucleoid-associated protein YgaU
MALSRYRNDLQIRGGKILQTNESVARIRQAFLAGQLTTQQRVLQEGERLDIIAGQAYGDGRLWWVIAAASGIGWFLQVPPGTLLEVPLSLEQISRLV